MSWRPPQRRPRRRLRAPAVLAPRRAAQAGPAPTQRALSSRAARQQGSRGGAALALEWPLAARERRRRRRPRVGRRGGGRRWAVGDSGSGDAWRGLPLAARRGRERSLHDGGGRAVVPVTCRPGGYVNLPATGADGVRRCRRAHASARRWRWRARRLSALGLRVVRGEEAAPRGPRRRSRGCAPPPAAAAGVRPAAAAASAAAARRLIGTPVTSRARGWRVSPTRHVQRAIKSVLATWRGPRRRAGAWRYAFYVGVDVGDAIYDAPGADAAFRRSFDAAVGGAVGTERAALVPLRYGLRGLWREAVADSGGADGAGVRRRRRVALSAQRRRASVAGGGAARVGARTNPIYQTWRDGPHRRDQPAHLHARLRPPHPHRHPRPLLPAPSPAGTRTAGSPASPAPRRRSS